MKKTCIILLTLFFGISVLTFAQSKKNDIPVSQLPANIKRVLEKYVEILRSNTLEECAEKFVEIAGGGLVNPDFPVTLYSDLKRFSLKKDYQNIKFYARPLVITRVNVSESNGDGYGATAIAGTVYKIWIKKKDGVNGMPAPIQILNPKNHEQIKTPKVVGIGSL